MERKEEIVKDGKGLVISYWNRYFKKFNRMLQQDGLMEDLNQEIELIGQEIQGMPLPVAGRIMGKAVRKFLKNIGMHKKDGYWVKSDSV